VNIHVRPADSGAVRTALLFRDFLRARPSHTADWSELKAAAARLTSDLASYGALKLPAWRILMALAEGWAAETGWYPAGVSVLRP
jgi:dephospho-CoA kinase